MIRILSILLLFIYFLSIITSCNSNSEKFIGEWIDKDSESKEIVILRKDKHFTVSMDDKKYLAEVNENVLKLTNDATINFFIDQEGYLIYEGDAFIKKELGVKRKFLGKWKINKGNSNKYDLDNQTISIEELHPLPWINFHTDEGHLKSRYYNKNSFECIFYYWNKGSTKMIDMNFIFKNKDTIIIRSADYESIAIRIK